MMHTILSENFGKKATSRRKVASKAAIQINAVLIVELSSLLSRLIKRSSICFWLRFYARHVEEKYLSLGTSLRKQSQSFAFRFRSVI